MQRLKAAGGEERAGLRRARAELQSREEEMASLRSSAAAAAARLRDAEEGAAKAQEAMAAAVAAASEASAAAAAARVDVEARLVAAEAELQQVCAGPGGPGLPAGRRPSEGALVVPGKEMKKRRALAGRGDASRCRRDGT